MSGKTAADVRLAIGCKIDGTSALKGCNVRFCFRYFPITGTIDAPSFWYYYITDAYSTFFKGALTFNAAGGNDYVRFVSVLM